MSLTNDSPEQAAQAAKISSRKLATLPTEARNAALDAVHDALSNARDSILAANAADLELAKTSAANGELSPSILKRLDLGRKGKFDDMLQGIRDVRALEDPGRPLSILPYSMSFDLITFNSLQCFNSSLPSTYILQNEPADLISRQGGLTDRTGQWSSLTKANMSHRRAFDHLRSSSRGHCKYRIASNQVCQCGYPQRREGIDRIIQSHCVRHIKSAAIYSGSK